MYGVDLLDDGICLEGDKDFSHCVLLCGGEQDVKGLDRGWALITSLEHPLSVLARAHSFAELGFYHRELDGGGHVVLPAARMLTEVQFHWFRFAQISFPKNNFPPVENRQMDRSPWGQQGAQQFMIMTKRVQGTLCKVQ